MKNKHFLSKLLTLPLILLIWCYKFLISPFLKPSCRFYPSCSNYALDALQYHALPKALWLITKRLLRCHPFCEGGIDEVPNKPNCC